MRDTLYTRVVLLQFEVSLGQVEDNLATVKSLLGEQAAREKSLVVLPELWATGFDYPCCRELAAKTPSLLGELQTVAAENRVVIAGSLLEPEEHGGAPWNTLFVVDGSGVVGKYRKQHLFGLWKENQFFTAGDRPEPIETGFGVLGGLVCYDLRFPELARDQVIQGAQVMVVSAQWPKIRLDHWRVLLRARAIENQVFVVAANCSGTCGKAEFAGHSMVVAPDGEILAEAGAGRQVVHCELPPDAVEILRDRFCSVGERPWLTHDREKVHLLAELSTRVEKIRAQGSRVAFTNGCFDLLHSGHVSYLEQARHSADFLVVGLNSDRSVRALKGESRPVNSELERARVLAALGCVDYVVIFDEDTPLNLIKIILPDVLVKGADWPEEQIVGAAEVKEAGGRVERIAFEHQCSTTGLIEKIKHY